MKTLEEIIAEVAPETMRAVLLEKQQLFQRNLAERVAAYEIERANPSLEGKDRETTLQGIEREIRKWYWAVAEIDTRLNESAEALHGLEPEAAAEEEPQAEAAVEEASEPKATAEED